MNLSQSPLARPGLHDGRPLILPYVAPPVELTYRNAPRDSAARDARILKVIRRFRRFARFNEIYQRVKGSRGYLEERLRVMAEDGRIVREKYDDKSYLYRVAS